MIKGFSKKKIENKKTLGEIFKEKRKTLNLSIEEAEIESKVKAKYLSSLESDNWDDLPYEAYIRGFVLAYGKVLKIKKEEILELFAEQVKIQNKRKSYDLSYQKSIKEKRILITPKVIGYFSLSVFLVSMFGYILFQLLSFAGSPNLKVTSPSDNEVLEVDYVKIKGVVDNDTFLFVNGESIAVTRDGYFSTDLKLHRGLNVVKVKAVNKANKETIQVLTLEHKPKTALNDTREQE